MKTLIAGDLHLKQRFILPRIDRILEGDPSIRRVVFLGDACDDWGAGEYQALDAMEFYASWVEARRAQGLEINVLLGNHDFCYIRGRRGPGSLMAIHRDLQHILEDRLHARMACVVGPYLCSHAGLTGVWARGSLVRTPTNLEALANRLNDMLADADCWAQLDSCPPSRGGWSFPGPLWADLYDLMAEPMPKISQIVGHTPVPTVERYETPRLLGDLRAVWACDTFSLESSGAAIGDGSMLLVDELGEARVVPFPDEAGYAQVALSSVVSQ